MDFGQIRYHEANGVARILLDRPRQRNALSVRMMAELEVAIARAAESEAVRVVVLGSTSDAFSAGADLLGIQPGDDAEQVILQNYYPFLQAVGDLPKPVIAAVPGIAAGIGVSLALACDLVVMSDQARLYLAFRQIGLVPDGGACWLLLQHLGYQRAFRLCIEGGNLDADQCLQLGLANKVFAAQEMDSAVLAWAEELACGPSVAYRKAKEIFRNIGRQQYDTVVAEEARAQKICSQSADFREGVSAFVDRRKPSFTGR